MTLRNDSINCSPRLRNAALAASFLWLLAACDKPQPPKPVPSLPETPVVLATTVPPSVVELPVSTNAPPPPPAPEEPKLVLSSNIIAFVGTEPVTLDDFNSATAGESLEALPEYLRRQYAALIEVLINNHVVGFAADHESFTNEPGFQTEVEQAVRQVKMRYFYDRYVQSKSVVPDIEIKEYYTSHTPEYLVPEAIRVRHILVEVKKGALPAEATNAVQKARGLRRRVMEGESFSELAAAESDCPSKGKGGDLGFRQRGQLAPSVEKAAFALRDNQISDVVLSEFGYHIIQVTDRMPERRRAFDEVRNEIRDQLTQRREQQIYADLLAALTNRYQVIRNEKTIKDLVHSNL